jgi:DNA polymerase (family X)
VAPPHRRKQPAARAARRPPGAAASRDLSNGSVADELALYASLLELAGANRWAARTYRRAADLIRSLPAEIVPLVRSGRARELRGIGAGVEAKLHELVTTGRIEELVQLQEQLRPELAALGHLLGLRARRMIAICEALGVTTPGEFRHAAEVGRLEEAPGVGPVTAARIRAALGRGTEPLAGLTIDRSLALLEDLAGALGGLPAGEPRRFCPLSRDLAVVVAAADPAPVLARFADHPQIVTVLESDARSAVGLTLSGVPVRVTVAAPERLGAELIRATGPPDYVAALGPLPDGHDEESVFTALGQSWCPPELRESRHPHVPLGLVETADLRGDLHCHTTWSDGRTSVLEMGRAARERGLDYLAVCDHTQNVRVVPGLDADGLRRQGEEIAAANEELAGFRILRGVECDILGDGSLDVPDDVLRELEWVQISLHAGQRRESTELTRIVSEAMRNPFVCALSHPTGRILNHRPENAIDLHEIYAVAVETSVALEINGLPDRLDLSSEHAADALAAGARLVLSSDAHSVRGLANLELAVRTARRAGATRDQIVNAQPVPTP